ncbi:hypothetical protein CERSUDRAFT_116864 [Gelatoporia subvermispora B]|uniref:BHLH domain-containing protein n=1 Tax=Ceriporiopsis subvermispora (strain B) TaxID=914234 RepID=M2R7L0_CERS8|nr:hypothetical protein CERSUDRAFT_116864 [Gelatoporia subvermispora B]
MSTPPPLSSSSSSTSSPSPTLDHPNLKSDQSDPFDFLLQTISQSMETPQDPAQQQDWSQLSTWAQQDIKYPDLASDFNFSLPMDLDFDPNMSVDPSALHFSSIFDNNFPLPPVDNTFVATAEPLQEQLLYPPPAPTDAGWPAQSSPNPRRLSDASSYTSTSGSAFSPISESASVGSSSPSSDSLHNDAAHDLAQRVRQMAGVTLAVPVSAQVQQLAAAGGQTKLPIPRLPRPALPTPAKQLTPKTSPAPDTFPSSSPSSVSSGSDKADSPSPAALPASSTGVIGRPKTSHTTIERRYRTNLNARITGLKHAVPALRVLEAKNVNGGTGWGDVVDARGFVDGVKVARKMSKANVLGKATEYIRVLKKREARLKREQDGLKALVAGLVGGPALLKEWDREWRARFGGAEADEIEGDDERGGADGDDDEDGDEDSDDDDARVRKRTKVAVKEKPTKEKERAPPRPQPAPASAPAVPGAAPEKRKRGRPRKVPLPPPAVVPAAPAPTPLHSQQVFPTDNMMQDALTPGHQQQQQPAQQYLLAAFAFFSVFNSPLTSFRSAAHPHAHAHAHQGMVLTPHASAAPSATVPVLASSQGVGLHELMQAVHLLVSTLVFFYVLVPWLSSVLRNSRLQSLLSHRIDKLGVEVRDSTASDSDSQIESENESDTMEDAQPAVVAPSKMMTQQQAHNRMVLMDALQATRRGSKDEAECLRAALGVSTGVLGLMQGVIKASRVDRGIELNQLEQRAWVRLGELVAFDDNVGKTTRLQTYWCMSWHISTFSASTTDLSTLALIIRPVSHKKATALWEQARRREILRAHERLVLNSMSVDDAAEWLAKWQRWHETERKGRCAACEKRTPLGVLAAILLRERLRRHAAALFVRTVVRNELRAESLTMECGPDDAYVYDAEKDLKEEQERRDTVEAGRSIGGRTAELAVLLERIWDTGFCTHEDVLPARAHRHGHGHGDADADADCEDARDLASTDEAEIRALLSATIIYRRIFPSTFPACAGAPAVSFVLSPPPSPSRRNAALHMALRTALGSPAFEFAGSGKPEDEQLAVALEDARDRVVDMLVEVERACRRGGRL